MRNYHICVNVNLGEVLVGLGLVGMVVLKSYDKYLETRKEES